MAAKTVLILGGGVGGLVAARRLRERLSHEQRVVLIDKSPQHVFAPSLLWLMVGWRSVPQLTGDLRRLSGHGIEFVQAEIRAIDAAARKVTTSAGEFTGDYLVVALGAELAPQAMPGLAEVAHWYFDLPGAERLRDALPKFDGGRVVVAIAGMPYKCPGAPWEGTLLLDDYFRRRSIRERVEMSAFTPEPLPMPVAGPVVGQALRELVEARGVAFNGQVKLTAVDPARRELTFENGRKVEYDLFVTIPPHRPPQAVKESGLLADTGWMSVNPRTLATAFSSGCMP